jgi:hypothetical protein
VLGLACMAESAYSTCAPVTVRGLSWSPTGASSTGSCLLAVVTSDGKVRGCACFEGGRGAEGVLLSCICGGCMHVCCVAASGMFSGSCLLAVVTSDGKVSQEVTFTDCHGTYRTCYLVRMLACQNVYAPGPLNALCCPVPSCAVQPLSHLDAVLCSVMLCHHLACTHILRQAVLYSTLKYKKNRYCLSSHVARVLCCVAAVSCCAQMLVLGPPTSPLSSKWEQVACLSDTLKQHLVDTDWQVSSSGVMMLWQLQLLQQHYVSASAAAAGPIITPQAMFNLCGSLGSCSEAEQHEPSTQAPTCKGLVPNSARSTDRSDLLGLLM